MITELYKKAAELAGRDVEVVQTTDKKFIVEWMSFGVPPPPKGESEEKALEGFISHLEAFPPPADPPKDIEAQDEPN